MKTKQHHPTRIANILIIVFLISSSWLAAQPAYRPAGSPTAYIVQGRDTNRVIGLVQRYGGQITSRLDIIQGAGAVLSPTAATALLSEVDITAITPNSRVSVADNNADIYKEPSVAPASDYPDVIGADVVWKGIDGKQGVTGKGVTVAVVDSGIANMQGVRDRVVAFVDFVSGSGQDPVASLTDPNGHGTHVAGVIANNEIGKDGEWLGIAPDVKLVGVRVLNTEGFGTYEQVIQGVQWVVNHKDDFNIRVLNMSLVAPVQSAYWADPLNQAVMKAWATGITVVAAAGNGGPKPMSVGVPGNNPYVITVGAFTDHYTPEDWLDDYITDFSAAGPTLDGFVKPDVVAPGAHILSIMMPSSWISHQHEANQVDSQHFSMAGTSQAAAVVSGLAALVISNHKNLSPDQVKYRILATSFLWLDPAVKEPTSNDALYSMWQQGSGRVSAPDAVYNELPSGTSNGMNIQADIAGTEHYQGYSYYDEKKGEYVLDGSPSIKGDRYGVWAGRYGVWAGRYGVWAGSDGTWATRYGVWAGGYTGVWSSRYGVWAGSSGVWEGGYVNWAGGAGFWTASVPWSGTIYATPAFVADFKSGKGPDLSTRVNFINDWQPEISRLLLYLPMLKR